MIDLETDSYDVVTWLIQVLQLRAPSASLSGMCLIDL